MGRLAAIAFALCAFASASPASARVLLVGTYHGIAGHYSSIQAAVNAARAGDWILIGPADYKTNSSAEPAGRSNTPAGVLITKPRVHLRGMNRNTVIVDGTRSGPACSRARRDQDFGPRGRRGQRLGLNGIMVWKAADVWVQNLTACNFLGGSGDAGNEIWWNGGDGSGKIGGHAYYGSYLTATSTYFRGEKHAAQYGIFSSNWRGGTWDRLYASNFNDSGIYIGACQIQCFQTMKHAWAQWNALGYSGTNSGGPLLIEHSEFDHNAFGVDTNSQNNTDWPSPQSGRCPPGAKPPIAGAHSCWVLYKNYIHDNNNPNVPSAGAAAAGPVGTGVSIEGRDDTLMNNVIKNNGAWGAVFQPYPDTEKPPKNAVPCVGGARNFKAFGVTIRCLYDDWNNALLRNTFTHNGFFGNPTNGDFAQSTYLAGHPINCFAGNVDTGGTLTSSPVNLQASQPTCGPVASAPDQNLPYVLQALCDTRILGKNSPCPPGARYPRRTKVIMHPLPRKLPSMPNPCAGVPSNPWCGGPKAPPQTPSGGLG